MRRGKCQWPPYIKPFLFLRYASSSSVVYFIHSSTSLDVTTCRYKWWKWAFSKGCLAFRHRVSQVRRAQHRATTPPHGNEPVWASGKDASYVRCFWRCPSRWKPRTRWRDYISHWPGIASVFRCRSWRRRLGREKPGNPCIGSCPWYAAPDKQKKMNGWLDKIRKSVYIKPDHILQVKEWIN